ncbi:hypothetical protein KO361_01845 [Candidatus Woesearchaeota archaeon]|jgi:flagellar biosynthesis/type III secretory pathway M-ring protein FliF/YscJ|nr:hypothetical protein [Candidatus Woesearchaeota archaeon]
MDKADNSDFSMDSLKKFFDDVGNYFTSLNQLELIAWGLIGLGVILVIVGLIIM